MDQKSSSSLETGSLEDSLDAPVTTQVVEPTVSGGSPPPTPGGPSKPSPPAGRPQFWQRLRRRPNIYLLLFAIVLLVGMALLIGAYLADKHSASSTNLSSGTLTAKQLQQIANTDASVGSSGQVLNVQSSAVFAGKVLVRQDLDVAGNLHIGGTFGLNDLAVSGTTQLAQAQITKNLAVAGTTALQGAVTIASSLQVGGSGTFSGPVSAPQLTTSSLQLSGDLVLTRHITTGGATPTRTNGAALGSGGSTSVSGSDSGGSITINTGSNPAAGCFITINFSNKYNSTPHVLVTPIGAAAAGLNYYVNRSTSSFSVCAATGPPASSTFGFDYFVVD